MGSLEQGSFQVKLMTAVEELIKGQKSVNRLRELVKEVVLPENYVEVRSLLDREIMGSFSRVLSLLDRLKVAEAPPGANSLCSDEQRSEISSLKRKIQPPRRSGYRRRAHPYTCRTVVKKEIEDGYTWRKYGQKIIYGSTNQRSYYRCTHKNERGCQATRQVQKTEDNNMFAITYMGEHTCSAKLPNQKPCIISFDSNINGNVIQQVPVPSTLAPSIKHECDEEVLSNHSPRSASSEFPVFGDLSDMEGSAPVAHLMEIASDPYDVTSGFRSSSTSGLHIEFDPEAFKLDDMFSFYPDDYLN